MSAEIVQIVSRKNGELKSTKVKASPYEFTMATRAKWETIVADGDVDIRAGEYKKIPVKELYIEPDMVAMPCIFSQHAVASVLRIGTKGGCKPVEEERLVNTAYVIGQETGSIRKGDLLGILNLFPVMFTREATKPREVE
ncbi:Protein of unknown function DUF22 [Methanohalobium evestigatum Z-7303]|uniref:DUF22 domain-containing protein n=1 Tax=Methanohalobium evestigatum (strain ATCC BAA-1072 / DSM 3721 / NBRC 107634 / OCM 161 / Z-7303) TaxID=644295 RepID=D7E7T8_METEZ|nr:DUF22 domain-containing protein [Methanohalobium evestigatum]ADI74161.1 Protein of unknown function DUF22 [Methanohalobium evestigatum Z-7303]